MRRAGPFAALALALIAGCASPSEAGAPVRDSDRFATPLVRELPCPPTLFADLETPPPVRCGEIEVPIDYADPHGPTTTVVFRVLESPANAPRGVLFTHPGGPGGPALGSLSQIQETWPDEVLAEYDILAFDPRGIGQSGGASCQPQVDALRQLDPLPESAGSYAALLEELDRAVGGFFEDGACIDPNVAGHMGTANVARDLDVLRRALGLGRVGFVGRSYGAWLGAVYASRYPNHVDHFVLDAPPPPTADIRDWVLAFARLQQAALRDTIEACPAACELGDAVDDDGTDSFLDRLENHVHALSAEPRTLTPVEPGDPTGALTGVDVIAALAQLPYIGLDARFVLVRNVARLEADDPEVRRAAELDLARAAQTSPVGLVRADTLAVVCADQAPRLDTDDVAAVIDTLRAEDNLFASFALFFLGACPAFDAMDRTTADPPTLIPASEAMRGALDGRVVVVGSTGDRVVPFEAAASTASALGGAALITAEHDRHGTAWESYNGCAESALTAYLLGDSASSTTCDYERDYEEPCEILEDRSCRPGFKCGIFGPTTVPRCMSFEPGGLGDACLTTEFCDDGLHCTNVGAAKSESTCQPLCLDDAMCDAAGDEGSAVCSVVLPDLAGVCAPACDPFDDGCGPQLQCKRLRTTIDGRGVAHCVAEGWLAPGAGCNTADACAAGSTCRADRCVVLCDAAHPCAEGSCQPVGTGSLGHCE